MYIIKEMDDKDFLENAEKEKKELAESMKSSRRQEYVRKEMDKIRKKGKMKEDSIYDTHKIINEAEKTESEKSQDDLEPIVNAPMMDKE